MKIAACVLLLGTTPVTAATPSASPIPPARTQPFQETVFGATIDDPYRWMEAPANRPEMEAWLRQASAASVAIMAKLPEHDAFARVVDDAMRAGVRYTNAVAAGDELFYLRQDPADRTPKLAMRRNGVERVLFDPAKLAGGPTAMGAYSVSPGGDLVAVQAASAGGEIGEIRFLKVSDGSEVGARLGPVFGETELGWPGSDFLSYSRTSEAKRATDSIQDMHVMVARVGESPGSPVLGTAVAGAPAFKPVEIPNVITPPTSDWAIGKAVGARSDRRFFVIRKVELVAGRPDWRVITDYADEDMDAALIGDDLYLLSSLGAHNGKIIRHPLVGGRIETALPQSDLILESLAPARDGLYVVGVREGVDHVLFLPGGRGPARDVTLPFDGYVPFLTTNRDGSSVVFSLNGWNTEAALYEARAGRASALGVASTSWPGASGITVARNEAVSADGTRVPMVTLLPAGAKANSPLPTIMEGYGAYGQNNVEPWYNPPYLAWVAHGGAYVFCGTRGGNERGRQWHEDGREARKPNAHADFIACAERLEASGRTRSDMLVALGTSAGGTLVPPAVLMRPDLFAGLITRVGLTNVSRLAAAENGPNQFAEFGDPRTETGFKALVRQDAYLMLASAKNLPPTLVTLGLNDHRVAPWFNAKFTARAREKFGDTRMILVRADDQQGHGVGSARDRVAAEWADSFAFAWTVTHQGPRAGGAAPTH